MGDQVVKVRYADTIRRLTFDSVCFADAFSTFSWLEVRARELFQIPPCGQLFLTYTDEDGDVVTLADDGDLIDACVLQRLNPLRLNLTVQFPTGVKNGTLQDAPIHQQQELSRTGDMDLQGLKISSGEQTTDRIPQRAQQSSSIHQLPGSKELEKILSATGAVCREGSSLLKSTVAEKTRPLSDFITDVAPTKWVRHGLQLPDSAQLAGGGTGKDVEVETSLATPEIGPEVSKQRPSAALVRHYGIMCDECGMAPIVGPRFKSRKEKDHDLCSTCFQEDGNVSDYSRIDRPPLPRLKYPSKERMRLLPFMPDNGLDFEVPTGSRQMSQRYPPLASKEH